MTSSQAAYEQALERFHRSLAHRPPSGFRGSAAFRAAELPWLAHLAGAAGAGYEDWYLVDGWSAVGVLEEAAVARGHVTRHDTLAAMAGVATGAVYRLSEGHPRLAEARLGVWVSRAPGHAAADDRGPSRRRHGSRGGRPLAPLPRASVRRPSTACSRQRLPPGSRRHACRRAGRRPSARERCSGMVDVAIDRRLAGGDFNRSGIRYTRLRRRDWR